MIGLNCMRMVSDSTFILDQETRFDTKIDELKLFVKADREIKRVQKYHVSELVTGRYWQKHGEKFEKKKRVYKTLLDNLEFMRKKLTEEGLSPEIVHILLSRAIFIKYLEDRKDKNEDNVFPKGFFGKYLKDKEFFIDLLSDKEATYNLFKDLEIKFNGNIFELKKNEKSETKA